MALHILTYKCSYNCEDMGLCQNLMFNWFTSAHWFPMQTVISSSIVKTRLYFEIQTARLCQNFCVISTTMMKSALILETTQYGNISASDGSTDKTHATCTPCRCELKYSENTTNLGRAPVRCHISFDQLLCESVVSRWSLSICFLIN